MNESIQLRNRLDQKRNIPNYKIELVLVNLLDDIEKSLIMP